MVPKRAKCWPLWTVGQLSEDDYTNFPKLTERQRDCLRLVANGYQSKEIAKRLGLTPNTVDQYLREALRTLGVSRRVEAARLLTAFEQRDLQNLKYQSLELAGLSGRSPSHGSPQRGPATGGTSNHEVRDSAAEYVEVWLPDRGLPDHNDLSWGKRLLYIIVVAIMSVLAFGGLLAGMQSLSKLL